MSLPGALRILESSSAEPPESSLTFCAADVRFAPMADRTAKGICAALLLAFAFVSYGSVLSPRAPRSTSRFRRWAAGWKLRIGDYRLNIEDPPLWEEWAALPNGPQALRPDFTRQEWRDIADVPAAQWRFSTRMLWNTPGVDGVAVVNRSRAMMLLLSVALGAFIALWGRGGSADRSRRFWRRRSSRSIRTFSPTPRAREERLVGHAAYAHRGVLLCGGSVSGSRPEPRWVWRSPRGVAATVKFSCGAAGADGGGAAPRSGLSREGPGRWAIVRRGRSAFVCCGEEGCSPPRVS